MEREINTSKPEASHEIPQELTNLRKEVHDLRAELRHTSNELLSALNSKDVMEQELRQHIRDAERYRAIVHLIKSIEGLQT